MKNKILFLMVIFLSLPFLVSANNIEAVVPETLTVYTNQDQEVQVLLKNYGAKDTFYFSLWPQTWGTLDKYWISLNSGEEITLNLNINPPIDTKEGVQVFKFSISSLEETETIVKEIYLNVKRTSDVYISEIELNKEVFNPDETLIITPILRNVNPKQTNRVYTTIEISRNGVLIEKFDDFSVMEPDSTKKISHNFDIELTHVSGSYKIRVVVKDETNKVLHEKNEYFQINSVYNIAKDKEVKNRFIHSKVTIKIENKGNIPAKNFYVTESIPSFAKSFFYPEIEPTDFEQKENRIIYTWLIESLQPGETVEIKYQLRFTNVILGALIIIIIVALIIWFFFQPKLSKKYIGVFRGQEEVKVSLAFKNKERRELKNVVVRDIIPPIAKLVDDFDTITPQVKRTKDGIELTWKIRHLKPKEERVFTYKIKPIIGITGDLRLPRASFMYETRKGKKKRVCSKSLMIKGKVK